MLDGVGGDDLLAANLAHLTDLFLEGRFGRLLSQLRQDAADLGCPATALFVRQCLRPLVPGFIKRLTRPWRQPLPPWINRDCLRQTGALDWLAGERRARPRWPSRAAQGIHDELVGGWNNLVALPANERFSARFGIEARHPFWDRRLVEFLLAVPHEQRWQGPWRKAVLRRAMKGILPESIRWRRDKAEFSGMIDKEFQDRQRRELEELSRSSLLVSLAIIDQQRWRQFFSKWAQGVPSPRDRVTMENFVWLELWCRNARSLRSRS
jgi:asparagine synthase (glutamine-hydrolysing)